MSAMIRKVMQKFYRKADGHPERLPWHQEQPPPILEKVVRSRRHGRALDVGSGAGVFTVWMAQQGISTTGIDLFPEAVAMGQARASAAGVEPEFVTGDLFEYTPAQKFDLIFDSGCLHSLVGGSVREYRDRIVRWLAPRGDFVLLHWGKRHAFDWRPIGPRRRTEAEITALFAPELHLIETEVTDFETPLPFGPVVRGVGYWFRAKS